MFRTSRKIFILLAVLSLVFVMTACSGDDDDDKTKNESDKKAKYVFLFIGDGMATVQSGAAEFFLENDGIEGNDSLVLNKLPVQGSTTTRSSNSYITDSAAAGTALATGYKTNSGVISMSADTQTTYPTIAEMAKLAGKKVGIVSSVTINHATPAVFYAHNASRSNYAAIGEELVTSGFDYFAGGDINKKTDDILAAAQEAGYSYVNTKEEIEALTEDSGKVIAVHPKAALAWGAFPYTVDLNEDDMNLADFTEKGIELMKNNDEGFFMMVEGGKIDWACHANDAKAAIMDTVAFDNAVKVALDFYSEHPDETLIVVTGDHETGGMSLGFSLTGYVTYFERLQLQTVSYDGFTANSTYSTYLAEHDDTNGDIDDLEDLIEASYGLQFLTTEEQTVYEATLNDDSTSAEDKKEADLMLAMMLSDDEKDELQKALIASIEKNMAKRTVSRAVYDSANVLYGGYDPLGVSLNHIFNNKAGIAWTTYSHTGIPVMTYAQGVSQDMFGGYYDNTDIAKKLMSVMGVE